MTSCKDQSSLEVVVKVPCKEARPIKVSLETFIPSCVWQNKEQAGGTCLLKTEIEVDDLVHSRLLALEKALQGVEARHGLAESLPMEMTLRGPGRGHFRPGRVSPRLVIGPPRVSRPAGQKGHLLFIESQDAFGDGNHPSTRLALRLVDGLLDGKHGGPVKSQGWVLDAGCGSGVLALAAAALGDCKVLAVDLDPRAIAATRKNLRLNPGPASKTHLALGDLCCVRGPFFVTMANLVPPVHERACGTLWGAVEPGGWLILSGFCETHKKAILDPYFSKGALEQAFIVDNAWAGCLLWKPSCSRDP